MHCTFPDTLYEERPMQPAKPAAISVVPRRQDVFSFEINIYINTLIRLKKIN